MLHLNASSNAFNSAILIPYLKHAFFDEVITSFIDEMSLLMFSNDPSSVSGVDLLLLFDWRGDLATSSCCSSPSLWSGDCNLCISSNFTAKVFLDPTFQNDDPQIEKHLWYVNIIYTFNKIPYLLISINFFYKIKLSKKTH